MLFHSLIRDSRMIAPILLFMLFLPSTISQCLTATETCFWQRFAGQTTTSLEIVGATFVCLTGGPSDLHGGALSITAKSTLLISDSTFFACYVQSANDSFGGACFISASMPATIENCCGNGCFATEGQFIYFEGSAKADHAFNCSSLLGCGNLTQSGALRFGIRLSNVTATFDSVNSTLCSVSEYGAAFGSVGVDGSFSSLYLTVCNCSGFSIITVFSNSMQATINDSNFFWNSKQQDSSYKWVCAILSADYFALSSTHVAAMFVTNCIFSGNDRPLVGRVGTANVDKFVVVNCIFSDSLPSAGDANMTGNIANSQTASHLLPNNDASLCFATSCHPSSFSPTQSSSPLATATPSAQFIPTFRIQFYSPPFPRLFTLISLPMALPDLPRIVR
jgi:hypothetical protein